MDDLPEINSIFQNMQFCDPVINSLDYKNIVLLKDVQNKIKIFKVFLCSIFVCVRVL